MKDRLYKLIGEMDLKREEIMEQYLKSLEDYEGHRAADNAGELHDIDRHITNLHLELKRIEGMDRVKVLSEVTHG